MKKAILFYFILFGFIISCSNKKADTNIEKNSEEDYTIVFPEYYDDYTPLPINENLNKWHILCKNHNELLDCQPDTIFIFPVDKGCYYWLGKDYITINGLPFSLKTQNDWYKLKYVLGNKEYILNEVSLGDDIFLDKKDAKRIKNYLLTNTKPMYIIVTDEDNKEHKITVPCIPPKKKPYKE